MAEVGAYYITILPSMNSFTKKCKEELGAAGVGGGESFADRFKATLLGSAVGTALAGLASKAAGFLSEGLDAGIKRYDTLSNYPKVMENLGYSTDEAAKSIKTIQEHLDGLPTSTDEMVRLTTSIADSTGDLDLATKAALGFNDMLLASGATTADVTSATEIFNRILGKHSATTAQWASIQQHIPAHLTAIAEHMLGAGHSSEELRDALNDGTVSWDDFLRAIAELDESGYVNQFGEQCASVEQQARDMTGGIETSIRNVTNAVGRGWVAIMEVFGRDTISSTITNLGKTAEAGMKAFAGWLQYAKDKIGETAIGENFGKIMEAVSNAANDLQAKAGPVIQDVTDKMVAWIDKALQWLVDHGDQIGEFVGKIGDAIGDIAKVAGAAFEGFVNVMGDWIAKGLEWLINHGDLVAGTIKAIAAGLVFKGVAGAIGGVTGALDGIIHNFDTLGRVLPLLDGAKDLPDLFGHLAKQGGPLASVFGGLADKSKGAVDGFGKVVAQGGPLSDLFGKVAGGAEGAVAQFKYFAAGIGGVGDIIPSITSAFSGFGTSIAAVATGPVGVAIAVVAALALAIKTLWDNNEGFRNAVTNIWNGIVEKFSAAGERIGQALGVFGEFFGKVGSFLGELAGTFGQYFGGLLSQLGDLWKLICDAIAPAIVAAIDTVARQLGGAVDFVSGALQMVAGILNGFMTGDWSMFLEGLQTMWTGVFDALTAPAQAVFSALGIDVDALKTKAGEAFVAISQDIQRNLSDAATIGGETMGFFSSMLQGDWDGMAEHAENVWGTIDSSITDHLQAAKDSGIPIVSDLAAGALDAWEGLKKDLVPKLAEIGSNITNKWTEIKTGVGNTIDNIKSAASQKWSDIKTSVTETVENIKTDVTQKWSDIQSGIGDTIENIKSAASQKWSVIKTSVTETVENIKTDVTQKWSDIQSEVGDTVENLRTDITQKWSDIQSGIGGTVEDIKTNITDAFSSAKETALGIFESIRDGIVGKIEDAKNTLSNIIETIKGLFNFEWSLPAPKLPHITWHTQNIAGVVNIPVFDGVEWYAKGGIFDNPAIIGVGEAGREAALPLNPSTYREIARGIRDEMGDEDGVSVLVTGNTFVVREEADIDRVADALARKGRRERWAKR